MAVSLNPLVLLAAAILRIPARRIRALACGDEGALRDWLANESATRLAEARRDARVAARRLERLGARVVALRDEDYPEGLRDLKDPPPFLTVRGSLAPSVRRRAGVAIVGTRTPAEPSAQFAYELARRISGPVVSGLALGIDAAAHRGALDTNATTIAYVGNGLGATYPPEHVELEERIVANGGAILSEQLPGETVTRWALTRRDRLQAAHAGCVVLVESDAGGGAMYAMRAARAVARPWYALAPREGADFAGNERAIADGAVVLPWDAAAAARIIEG
ncbi:MAG: DNA-processing protein DprA [Candidatus Eremiobacteraeota bacterium]|nr:DNA-processing protein DprA [Candidatus Eremiobacteraeota bacterium]